LHTSSELPHLYAIWPLVASIAVKSGSSLMKFGYVDPQMTVQASHDLATRTRLLIRDASPTDRAKVRMRSSTGEILPAMVITASTTATTTLQISVNRISLRRSTMSPIGPGRESQNKERQDGCSLRQGYIHRSGIEGQHQPSGTHALHESADIRDYIGHKQIAEGW
jgi:hypothetical protein